MKHIFGKAGEDPLSLFASQKGLIFYFFSFFLFSLVTVVTIMIIFILLNWMVSLLNWLKATISSGKRIAIY